MKRFVRALAGVLLALAVLPAAASATPINKTKPSITSSGGSQPGASLFCDPGVWTNTANDGNEETTNYAWYHASNLSTAIKSGAFANQYTVATTDIGQQIVCVVTEKDLDDNTTATAQSSNSIGPVVPLASVRITNHSASVSGAIGESVSGVTVAVNLERPTYGGPLRTIAHGTATTSSAGAWSLTMTPLNPASGPTHGYQEGDVLTTSYTAPSGSTATMPPNFTYGYTGTLSTAPAFVGSSTTINSTGTTVTALSEAGCAALNLFINGTIKSMTSGATSCTYTASPALTDQSAVTVMETDTVSTSGATPVSSKVQGVDEVGLLGAHPGAPTCSADYVTSVVSCGDLTNKPFAVSVNGGTAVALTNLLDTNTGNYDGSATVSGLVAGAKVTLDESGTGATTRHITTLHLGTLRVDEVDGGVDGGSLSGSCQADEPFEYGGGLCPTTGTFATADNGASGEVDDLSGGLTTVTVPFLYDLIPSTADAIAGNSFTAYGTVSSPLSQVSSVKLTIRPHGSSTTSFSGTMAGTTDPDGPYESLAVSGLPAGLFFASFALTDSHGDTNLTTSEFSVFAPSSTPTSTPPPSTGATPSKAASASKVTVEIVRCLVRAKRRTTCRIAGLSSGTRALDVLITRGHRRYAEGSASVRGRVATVRLRGRHKLAHGRYLLTILSLRGGNRVVVFRHTVKLG